MSQSPNDRAACSFACPIRVRWAEVDAQSVVFNAHYLTYADVAITEYLRALGSSVPAGQAASTADTFVANANLSFRSSARFDDELSLEVRIGRLGRTSFTFLIGMWRAEELLCEAHVVYVRVDLETGRPTALSPAFVDQVLAFEKVPPDRA